MFPDRLDESDFMYIRNRPKHGNDLHFIVSFVLNVMKQHDNSRQNLICHFIKKLKSNYLVRSLSLHCSNIL